MAFRGSHHSKRAHQKPRKNGVGYDYCHKSYPKADPWAELSAELDAVKNRESTRRRYRRVLRDLVELAACPHPDAINAVVTRKLLDAWKDGRKPSTVNLLLATLQGICSYLGNKLERNPFDLNDWFLPVPKNQPKPGLLPEEFRRILAQADLEHRLARGTVAKHWARNVRGLTWVYSFAGLRYSEALWLRVCDVDLRNGFLDVNADEHDLKTAASAAPVPIAPELAPVLEEMACTAPGRFLFPTWLDSDRPWTGGKAHASPRGRIRALGERAGVQDLTPIRFRRGFIRTASNYVGFGQKQIAKVARQNTLQAQEFYDQRDPLGLQQAMQRFTFKVVG
jgi:integrase